MNLTNILEQLKEASQQYYETGESNLSDKEFDDLLEIVRKEDPNNKILSEVGHGYILKGIDEKEKFEHPIEVGSIDKSKSLTDIRKFLNKSSTFSTKIDGNSVVCYYKNRKLFKIVTRGTKNIGIDRTAKFIKIIPKEIPIGGYVAVRGEAAIKKIKYTEANGFDISKASRNAVAGAISRKDNWESVFKFVDFVAYTFKDCVSGKDLYDSLNWSEHFLVESQKEVPESFFNSTEEFKKIYKDDYEYEADGIVFKTGEEYIAFKFEDESARTVLEDIEWSIGKDQRLTPVALLEPVELAGATIERASLGSYSRAVSIGCYPVQEKHMVEIIRANEIIPYVTKTISSTLQNNTKTFPKCPVCGEFSELNGEHVFCVNPDCENIERTRLINFSEQFYPEGLSDKIIEKFFEYEDIETIFDLLEYEIPKKIPNIPGIGDCHGEKIITFLNNFSKEIDAKVVYKTFLLSCGERASEKIVDSGFDIYSFITNENELEKLEKISNFNSNIISDLSSKRHLISAFLDFRKVIQNKSKSSVGSFCITGARFKGEDLKRILELGWREDSSVKSSTTVLVTKDPNSNSTKIQKAKQLGVCVKSIEEFLEMIA